MNNGHTIQVNYASGSTLTNDGRSFDLKQFHFHSPSENRIEGKQFPLDGHLVHADKADDKAALPAGINVASMLPESMDYCRFNGSLITPPCSEGVWWFVAKKPVSLSQEQVDQFVKTIGFANNRPIQPVNARPVLK